MSKELITKADFAKKCGVNNSSVTKALKKGLGQALDGKYINLSHHEAIVYMASRGVEHTQHVHMVQNKPRISQTITPPKPPSNEVLKEEITNILHSEPEGQPDYGSYKSMTLDEILERHGSKRGFVDWLKARKLLSDIEKLDIDNAKKKGVLVNIQLVKTGVIDPFESLFRRLLSDGVTTFVNEISAMAISGSTEAEMKAWAKDQFNAYISPCKTKIKRTLSNV